MAAEGRLITLVFGEKHAVTTAVVSGAPTDADFVRTPPDGTLAVDGSAATPRLWLRANGNWLELDDLTDEVADLIVDMENRVVVGSGGTTPTVLTNNLSDTTTDGILENLPDVGSAAVDGSSRADVNANFAAVMRNLSELNASVNSIRTALANSNITT